MGGFATAAKAAGFDNLYGAGRSGFAGGGATDPTTLAPYQPGEGSQGYVSWVPSPAGQMMGQGPPKPMQPSGPSGQQQQSAAQSGQDLSKALVEPSGTRIAAKGRLAGPSPGPGLPVTTAASDHLSDLRH